MPGPKPKLNNGRIAIEYGSIGSNPHTCNLDCLITNPSGPGPYLLATQDFSTINWTAAVDRFVLKIKPLFGSGTQIQQATLYEYGSGIYTPIDTYSIGVAGTGGADVSAGETTITFKDRGRNQDKIVLLETNDVPPFKSGYGALTPPRKALVDDILSTASDAIGNWYQSKDDQYIQRFQFWTATYNRRMLRRLHI